MDKLNLRCYFDDDYAYVEEFDTPDDKHWMGRTYPEEWTPDIYQAAIDSGFVDRCLKDENY